MYLDLEILVLRTASIKGLFQNNLGLNCTRGYDWSAPQLARRQRSLAGSATTPHESQLRHLSPSPVVRPVRPPLEIETGLAHFIHRAGYLVDQLIFICKHLQLT